MKPVWPARVVAVTDHPQRIARGRPAEFRYHGVVLSHAGSGAEALADIGRDPATAVLVSNELPDFPLPTFIEVLHTLAHTPVIIGLTPDGDRTRLSMVVGRGDVTVVDLPVTPAKLLRALGSLVHVSQLPNRPLVVGALELDADAHRVRWHRTEVELPPRPFAVLEYLMASHPRPVSIQELCSEFGWQTGTGEVAPARAAIKRIRRALTEAIPGAPEVLVTVRRVGYRLVA